jgi:uncharacterized protein (TIGR02453 family)
MARRVTPDKKTANTVAKRATPWTSTAAAGPEKPDVPPFAGFPADALQFFRDLGQNQSREWFEANRHRYETSVKAPFASLVASVSFAFAVKDVPLMGDPAKSLFRIHRDVRFSKDKTPYKTHAGAILNRDGSKSRAGLLYLHVDPAGSFMATGFYMPEPDQLAAIRTRIAERQAEWKAVELALTQSKVSFKYENSAVRLPKPFVPEEVADVADAIRLKSFEVHRPISPKELARPDLVDRIVAFADETRPLLDFGWAALAAMPRQPQNRAAADG